MFALAAFVLFLIVAILSFLRGNVVDGLAFAGAAGVALHLAFGWPVPWHRPA